MNEKPLSLRLLKLLLALWWWGLLIGGIAGLILLFAASSSDAEFSFIGYASEIDTSALTAKDRYGSEIAVSFEGPAKVRLQLPNEAGQMQLTAGHKLISLALVLPFYLASVYFLKQLRDIVRTIDHGDPFAVENATRVRTIGMIVLGYVFIECLVRLAMSGYADSMIIARGFNLNGRIEINWALLMVGISVIVLSEVFRHGAKMREEQALTI